MPASKTDARYKCRYTGVSSDYKMFLKVKKTDTASKHCGGQHQAGNTLSIKTQKKAPAALQAAGALRETSLRKNDAGLR